MKEERESNAGEFWSNNRNQGYDRNDNWNQGYTNGRQENDWQNNHHGNLGSGYTGYAGNMNYDKQNFDPDRHNNERGMSSSDYAYRHSMDWNHGRGNQHSGNQNNSLNRLGDYNNPRYNTYRNNFGNRSHDQNNAGNWDTQNWYNNQQDNWPNRSQDSNWNDKRYNSENYNNSPSRYNNHDWDNLSRNPSEWHSRDSYNWNNNHDRGFLEKAGDEVRSWFGDEEAERRRRLDERQDRYRRNKNDGNWS